MGLWQQRWQKALDLSNGRVLGHRIAALRNKLDEDHFIHKIASKQRTIKGKSVTIYIFNDALTRDEEILAYFDEHKEALQEDGIVAAEMAKDLGFSNGAVLGRRIAALRNKLDEDHFIKKIIIDKKTIKGKLSTVYSFGDSITSDEEILAYFDEHKEDLQGDGIVAAEMAEALDLSHGRVLGYRIAALREKLLCPNTLPLLRSRASAISAATIPSPCKASLCFSK